VRRWRLYRLGLIDVPGQYLRLFLVSEQKITLLLPELDPWNMARNMGGDAMQFLLYGLEIGGELF
jgi:hypothetical protein